MITLQFKDKTFARCTLLGSVESNGVRYAVFLAENKELYIYKYKLKGKKCKLIPITDKNEFRKVCIMLNKMVKAQ